MSVKNKIKIEIIFTKNVKLRARVSGKNRITTEVTIGGKSWNEGKLREYHEIILEKAKKLVEKHYFELMKIIKP